MCDPYSSRSGAPKHWIVVPEQRQESPELASDARFAANADRIERRTSVVA